MKITLIMCCMAISLGWAQENGQVFNTGNERSWTDMQIGTVFEEVPIEGSPYMDEMYKMGVTSVHGKEISLLMRYNAYSDQIEMIDKRQKHFNLLQRPDLQAEFDGKTYVLLDYKENGNKKQGYFNPLNEGDVVLYFKPRKKFEQARKPESGYDDFNPPRYVDDHAYYIRQGGGSLEEIKLNKRNILRYLRDEQDAVKAYLEDNNLDLKSEEGVVTLLEYYHSLGQS